MILGTAPNQFSPGGFLLSQTIGQTLVGVGLGLVVLFFMIDLTGSALTFKVKDRDEIIRLTIMFIMGGVFVRASFWLCMYIFENFQGVMGLVITQVGGHDNLQGSFDFISFTDGMRTMIDDTYWHGGYRVGTTENTILFIFLVFTFLGIFGMLLSVLIVPVVIFIELFIYSAFSPIPISTLFTSQRAIGIAFLKTYASVCLRGAIMIFGIALSAHIMNSAALAMPNIALEGILYLIIPISQMTLSIMVMKKGISGAEGFSKVITGAGG